MDCNWYIREGTARKIDIKDVSDTARIHCSSVPSRLAEGIFEVHRLANRIQVDEGQLKTA